MSFNFDPFGWGKAITDWWNKLTMPVAKPSAPTQLGQGPLTLQGVLRNPDGSLITNAKLTLKTMETGTFLGLGTSGADGKYCFAGVPTVNFSLEIEEPGKTKRVGYINTVAKIQGVRIFQGMVVPSDLTVEYPQAPAVSYGVGFMPPTPEYKPVVSAPYVGVPPTKAERIYA